MAHLIRHETPLSEPIHLLSGAEAAQPASGLFLGKVGTVHTAFRHRRTTRTARILKGGPK